MNILHILKTQSINSDGRVLKTINSLANLGHSSKVVVLEDENIKQSPKKHDFPIISLSLHSRKWFGKHKGYFFKIPEFTYKSIREAIRSNYTFWIFHDGQSYLSIFLLPLIRLLSKQKLYVAWDQHELPHPIFVETRIGRWVLNKMISNVDFLIFTNIERKNYVNEVYNLDKLNCQILNNYPNSEFIEGHKKALPTNVGEWLGVSEYILWQGIASKNRSFLSFLDAYLEFKDRFKLIVLGSMPDDVKVIVEDKIGSNYKDYLYQDFVPQEDIVKYIDNAKFTTVFYKNLSLNSWYCEANRLYQPLSRGIPIIVGSNPPLKQVVDDFEVGIVVKDDGTDSQLIKDAMFKLINNYEFYSSNCKGISVNFDWDKQCENVYLSIIDNIK